MEMDKKTKSVIIIIVCLVITVFSFVMKFAKKNDIEPVEENVAPITKEIEKNNNVTKEESKIPGMETYELDEYLVSVPDDETGPETINENEQYHVYIYFTNRGSIDDDNFLPLSVHSVLLNATQKFLEAEGITEAEELYVIQESIGKNNEECIFECLVNQDPEKHIEIRYSYEGKELQFSRLNKTGGEPDAGENMVYE